MKRLWIPTLIVAGAFGLWQLAPAPFVQAGPSVDAAVGAVGATPASFADVIEAVQPAVVNISVRGAARDARPRYRQSPAPRGFDGYEDFLRRFFERQSYGGDPGAPAFQGMGSGFIIDPDGYVVTNHHVVERASEIAVTLVDGTRLDAELVGTDPKTDLALLKVVSDEELPYARFGTSETTRVGDWVVAIGNPFGLGGSATAGIVSARGRDIQSGPFDDFLQIDAPINRGNSGGPLFDLSGQVIGINTAIYSPNGGSVGIGFAIPSEQAEDVIEDLKTSGRVERGWLGVTIQGLDEDLADGLGLDSNDGAIVASVVPGSPAEDAGLEPGDVIVGVGGEPVRSLKDVTRRIAAAEPDEELAVEVWRNGSERELEVEIGRSPDSPPVASSAPAKARAELGLALGELSERARGRLGLDDGFEGVVVTEVAPGSPAAARGLARGDVVVRVGQNPISNVEEAIQAIETARDAERDHVVLQVVRNGAAQFVAIPLA